MTCHNIIYLKSILCKKIIFPCCRCLHIAPRMSYSTESFGRLRNDHSGLLDASVSQWHNRHADRKSDSDQCLFEVGTFFVAHKRNYIPPILMNSWTCTYMCMCMCIRYAAMYGLKKDSLRDSKECNNTLSRLEMSRVQQGNWFCKWLRYIIAECYLLSCLCEIGS